MSAAPLEDSPSISLAAFRPSQREVLSRLVPTLVAVGLVMFFGYALLTEVGRVQLDQRGFLPLLLGWLAMLLLCILGAVAALAAERGVSTGLRSYTRRRVLPLAIGHSILAAAGATFCSFWISGGAYDLLTVMTCTFVLTLLFTASVLVPAYLTGFAKAEADRS
ncbi:hypothetical protein [Pseudoclavibacter sp. VKM Ac-2867]|uniref:hypothetical protein n=1 Tax=Pseudoclavibacter sp. VKM Ac-2867 TaxID=2783829 RepID=UPI00188AECC3|nr:hypothetical protein [Pseudoclavibacter sp. VKM Ac-2867]MBF4458713.1 hypothetical protein [Pseudoclavibacter sp. VKM Ac-2867]